MSETEKEYDATLTNGKVYVYRGIRFVNGKKERVSEEIKNYLEKEAVIEIKNQVGDQLIENSVQRFTFEDPKAKSDAKARPARV